MATLEVTTQGGLQVFTVTGELSRADVLDSVTRYYPSMNGSRILWDLRACSDLRLTSEDLRVISQAVFQATQSSGATPWKIAYLVGTAQDYTVMCRYLTQATLQKIQTEYSVFRDLAGAQKWLAES